jgi:RecA-family ATPase
MRDIKPRPIEWLWPGRIACGKVTLLAGDPGLGKSMLTVALASHVSNGSPWPVDASPCRRGGVIMLSAEDDPEDTIRPRLDAAGADINRVHCIHAVRVQDREKGIKERPFNLDKDLDALDRMLARYAGGIDLVTVDPISAYLGGTDSHNNADIRGLLSPLSTLASKHRVAVVAVTHLNKSAQANIMYRATGSLAFVAASRAVFGVVKDPDDPSRRLLLPIKNNLGDDRTGYAYTISTADNDAPVIRWEPDAVETTLEEMADAVTERKQRPVELIKAWLTDLLSHGPMLASEIHEKADTARHVWVTVKRAKKDLGIESIKKRFDGQWEWRLPAHHNPDLEYLREIVIEGDHEGDQHPPVIKQIPLAKSDPLGDTKGISSNEGDQKTCRGVVIPLGDAYLPGALISAAVTACAGLKLTPGRFITELDQDDYPEIISNPITARSVAVSMDQRGIQ